MPLVEWTDYLKYRASIRGFDLVKLEDILLHSSERYFDTETGRSIVVGRYGRKLVMIPYETKGDSTVPVTVHATTRQQIRFRVRTGRFIHE
jgi:hypothetical protein